MPTEMRSVENVTRVASYAGRLRRYPEIHSDASFLLWFQRHQPRGAIAALPAVRPESVRVAHNFPASADSLLG